MCEVNVSEAELLMYDFDNDISYLRTYGRTVERAFSVIPYTIGILQCILNCLVLTSIVAIIRKRDSSCEKPAFVFIGNLAVSDILAFFVQMAIAHFRVKLSKDRKAKENCGNEGLHNELNLSGLSSRHDFLFPFCQKMKFTGHKVGQRGVKWEFNHSLQKYRHEL